MIIFMQEYIPNNYICNIKPKRTNITIIGQKPNNEWKIFSKIFLLSFCTWFPTAVQLQFYEKFQKTKLVSIGMFSIKDDFLGSSLAKYSQNWPSKSATLSKWGSILGWVIKTRTEQKCCNFQPWEWSFFPSPNYYNRMAECLFWFLKWS